MRIKIEPQGDLAKVWFDEDNGDWIITGCRRGLSKILGMRIEKNKIYTTDLNCINTVIEDK